MPLPPCENTQCLDKWNADHLTLCHCRLLVCDTCLEDHKSHKKTTWSIRNRDTNTRGFMGINNNYLYTYTASRISDRVELYLCNGCEEHFPLEEFTEATGKEYCPTCTEYCLSEGD